MAVSGFHTNMNCLVRFKSQSEGYVWQQIDRQEKIICSDHSIRGHIIEEYYKNVNPQLSVIFVKRGILIHYDCNAHFHWLWRQKFAALKSLRLCHESSDDVTSLATRRSIVTKTFWKSVLSEWIRMVITRFVFERFAGINCIILRSQISVLPLRWRVAVKLNLRP